LPAGFTYAINPDWVQRKRTKSISDNHQYQNSKEPRLPGFLPNRRGYVMTAAMSMVSIHIRIFPRITNGITLLHAAVAP
jgi:hypothetical protein